MKKIVVTALIGSFVIFMVNCSPKVANTVTAGPVPTSDQVKSQYSAAQLDQGKTIWQNSCNKCHKLFEPGSHDPEQWNNILKRMIRNAKLDLSDAQLVRAYLIANAAAPGTTQHK